jgi:outer membrane protein TolC
VALAEFDKTVLDALRDVQTILTRYAEDLQRLEALTQVRDHAKTAAENERALYQAGRQAYLFSLDADRVLSGAEASLAEAEAQIAQDQVRLFLALGGGWRKGEVLSAAADAPRA